MTNPPATPRPVIANPTFPAPPSSAPVGNLDPAGPVRPREPARARLERERAARVVGRTTVTAGLRGLARPAPAAQRRRQLAVADDAAPTARRSSRRGAPRPNTAFSTIELKSSDGDSWYNALIFEVRRRWSSGFSASSRPTRSRTSRHHAGVDVLLGRHQRHDLGVPGVHPRLQQGAGRLPREPQLGAQLHLGPAVRAASRRRRRRRRSAAGSVSGIWHLRSGSPLTAFVQTQPLALAVGPVARPGHRAGPAELRARLRSRQRGARQRRSVVRSGRVRAAAGGHVRQHRRGALPPGPTCARSISRS